MRMTSYSTVSVGRGLFFVAAGATAWGTAGAVAAILFRTSGLGPVAVSFWRFAAGAAILAAACAIRRRPRPGRPRWRRLALTGAGMAVYHTAYFGAVAEVGVAVATVVTLGAGPVLIAVGARLALAERLGARGVAMVTTALAGLVLLTGGAGSSGLRPVLGCALALVSASGYTAITLLARANRTGDDPGTTAFAGFGVGAVCLLPWAIVEGIQPDPASVVTTAGWVLYLGAVPTALGYGLFFAGLAAVRAATASVVALLEAVTATAIAVAALGERLTLAAIAGTVTLLGAVAGLVGGERDRAAPVSRGAAGRTGPGRGRAAWRG
jgi:DME family drug/metabolite transporter